MDMPQQPLPDDAVRGVAAISAVMLQLQSLSGNDVLLESSVQFPQSCGVLADSYLSEASAMNARIFFTFAIL